MKKLQLKTADGWAFVFCRDQRRAAAILAESRRRAFPGA